ncbi:ABC transporter permease [Arthrobacter ginkgonis]|uniref:ABC transporter permease n=1 Tax=Arthrobacter ginkgonis TaxID=1630594 RepID=A0ABP7CY42_9MICC
MTLPNLSAPSAAAGIGSQINKVVRGFWNRRTPWLDRFSIVLVGVMVAMAVLGPLFLQHDPYQANSKEALLPPSPSHWMGTDDVGRDVLSRLVVGAGQTIFAAALIVLLATVVGILVASIAAVSTKWIDETIMRACDIFMSLPSLVLALGIAAALGSSMTSIIIAMVGALWPSTARLARGIIRETMTSTYTEAARILGVSKPRLLLKHVLPNSLDAIYVHASMEVSGTIVMMSGLAFLGVGAPPPSADWGSMIAQGKDYITSAWWVALFPGIGITLGAIAFGLLGDAVRNYVDPTTRRS